MHIRAKAMSLSNVVNRGMATIFASTFLTEVQGLTFAGFFIMFFFFNVLGVLYIYYLIPETANVPLEQMSTIFDAPAATDSNRGEEDITGQTQAAGVEQHSDAAQSRDQSSANERVAETQHLLSTSA